MNEERLNKIKKVIYWRAISFTVATVISYFYLGELRKSLELTIILSMAVLKVLKTSYPSYEFDMKNH